MKPGKKAKRLKLKQEAYDKMVKEHPDWVGAYRRPGSVQKS